MPDFTVGTASTTTPDPGQSALPPIYYKGAPLAFSAEQRERLFWAKLDKTAPGGCWIWTGAIFPHGYGKLTLAKRSLYPHRVSYEIHKGRIPDGLHIDHLCRVRSCANPEHLEAVTCGENIRRSPIAPAAINAVKTHCARGHEFTEANTIITATGRNCRTCRRWHERRVEAKKRGLPLPESPDEVMPRRRSDSCPNGHPYDEGNTYVDPKGTRRCRTCAREDCARYRAKRAARGQQ